MINSKKLKTILILSIITILSITCLFFVNIKTVNAGSNFEIGLEGENVYSVGTLFEVPDGYYLDGDTKILLQHIVDYPDDRSTTNKMINLDVAGKYVLTYYLEYDIEVRKSYVLEAKVNKGDLFTVTNNGKVTGNADAPSYILDDYNGIKLSAKSANDVFTYNRAINLTDKTSKDKLFSYIYAPVEYGSPEFIIFNVTFTDIFDSSRYFTVEFLVGIAINYPDRTIINCWGSNQTKYRKTHISVDGNATGLNTSGYPDEVSIYFDYASKCLYASKDWGSTRLIVDLVNNPGVAGDPAWEGFTNGWCTMSISFERIMSNTANIIVLTVDNQDLSGEYVDNEDEEVGIAINYGEYDGTKLPDGVVGYSYPVFDSIAQSSIYGEFSVNSINVISPSKKLVPIIDGRFETSEAGKYTVVYTAVSPLGNTYKKNVKVKVLSEYQEEIGYTFSDKLSETVNIFDEYILYKGVSKGGSGNIRVVEKLMFNGEELEILDNGVTKYFIPTKTGTYLIVEKVTDELNNTVLFAKEITAVSEKGIVFEDAYIPSKICVGQNLLIPQVKVKEYLSYKADTYNADVYINGNLYTEKLYKVTNTGEITLTYKYKTEEVNYKIEAVKLIDGTTGFMKDYFLLKDGNVEFIEKAFTFNAEKDNASFTFINRILTKSLAFSFTLVEDRDNFSKINFKLIDCEDLSNTVVISLVKNGDDLYLEENGRYLTDIDSLVYYMDYEIVYNAYSNTLTDINKNVIGTILSNVSSKKFEGFKSDYVYLEVSIEGIKGNSSVQLKTIANQTISSSKYDIAVPLISLVGDVAAVQNLVYGQFANVSAIHAYDVFDVDTILPTVEIISPSGKTVYNGDISEGYMFLLDELGTYRIKYSAVDKNGNSNTYLSSYYSINQEEVKIQLTGKFATSTSAGKNAKLANFTVSGVSGETYTAYYVIVVPSGQMKITTADTFTFTQKGINTVRIVVFDKNNTSSYCEYFVEVR